MEADRQLHATSCHNKPSNRASLAKIDDDPYPTLNPINFNMIY
jgi:hypothetical protein